MSLPLSSIAGRPHRSVLAFRIAMHLIGCQDQKEQHLDAFYTEVTQWDQAVSREIGKVMLSLVARLRALPDERRVFGLTSHLRLCLLAEDTWKSSWYVIVSALDSRNYTVEYLMPQALLHGHTLMSGVRRVQRMTR